MKDSYKRMRNSGNYNLDWFHKYYIDKKGAMDINTFQMVFNYGNLDMIIEHLDKEFNLVKVEDNNGKLIKVI
jgi:hypothetical protein